MMTKCTWEGCAKSVECPHTFALPPAGWAWLEDWPGIPDGLYCRQHADALEVVLMEGGFDDPENDLDEELDEEAADEADLQRLAARLCVTAVGTSPAED